MSQLWMMVAVPFLAQAAPANPDLKYVKEQGFSIMKPVKNEEWGFKDKGFYQDSKAIIYHKVDTLTIEVLSFVQFDALTSGKVWDAKKQAEAELAKFTGNTQITINSKKEPHQARLPMAGAGNVNAWHVTVNYKAEDGKAMDARIWTFVGRESQNAYIVAMIGEDGMYKKHQKAADFIFSTLKIWKIPK